MGEFNWQLALGPTIGRKVEKILDSKSSKTIKKSDIKIDKISSLQEFFPIKTIVNGIAVHSDECTFVTYIKVGRVNFQNKDEETKELLLQKHDEVLNTTDQGQFFIKKGKLNAELLLYSMEANKTNLVGFEKEFYQIQKEHYHKEIYKRNISSTDRLVIIQCQINRGKYKDKLQEAIRILAEEQLAIVKKFLALKVNYIHVCNTLDVLEILMGELTTELQGGIMEKLKLPGSGVFVTKENEVSSEDEYLEIEKLDTKGDDLLAIGEWNFKDLIADSSIHFAKDYVMIGRRYLGIKCISTYSDQITEKTFDEIFEQSQYNLMFSIHFKQQEKGDIIAETQGRLDKLEREIITNVSGRGSNSIEKKKLQKALIKLNHDTNNFLVKIYFGIVGNSFKEMTEGTAYIDKMLKSRNMRTYLPALEMKEAFLSLLPLGKDYFDEKIDVPTRIGENFLTQALSCINIFQGTDLVHTTKRAFRYGYDRDTNNFIVADRVKYLLNPAGMILGTPGTGKSASSKHEIGEAILTLPPGDQIFTVDYIGEYTPFCKLFGYPEMFFDNDSENYINALDLNPYSKNPLNEKADKFVEYLEILLDRKFDNIELTAIDNAFYRTFAEKGITEKNQHQIFKKVKTQVDENVVFGQNQEYVFQAEDMPILEDFQRFIKSEGEKGAYIADELNIYVSGTHRYMNHITTLSLNARYTNFNLSTVRNRIKPAVFYLIKEKLAEKGLHNFNTRNKRIIYLYYDEMHRYFRNERMGAYLALDYKEGRKEGLVPTGITQNVQDLLRYDDGIFCLINADYVLLLGTDKNSREIIAKHISLSKEELNAFDKEASNPGDGLLIFKGDRIPIHISCSDWELENFDTLAH